MADDFLTTLAWQPQGVAAATAPPRRPRPPPRPRARSRSPPRAARREPRLEPSAFPAASPSALPAASPSAFPAASPAAPGAVPPARRRGDRHAALRVPRRSPSTTACPDCSRTGVRFESPNEAMAFSRLEVVADMDAGERGGDSSHGDHVKSVHRAARDIITGGNGAPIDEARRTALGLANSVSLTDREREHWRRYSVRELGRVLTAVYLADAAVRRALRATGNRQITVRSTNSRFWCATDADEHGRCSGHNMHGEVWMMIRSNFSRIDDLAAWSLSM